MLLALPAGGVCLLWVSLLVSIVSADPHSQFDYRGHHAHAAALANGHAVKGDGSHEAPRIRERFAREEPERWFQYIPHSSKSIAEEMSEARRIAREEESKKFQMDRQEQENKVRQEAEEAKQARIAAANSDKKNNNGIKNKGQTVVEKAAKKVKAATKKTKRKVKAKAEHLLDLDEEDGDDDDDDDEDGSSRRNKSGRAGARIWGALRWTFSAMYLSTAWSGQNLLWTPLKYIVHGLRWSANTSWKTSRWTGERALVGPALTFGAPVIYLGEGFLYLFVYTPARIITFIARELYPIYIFLGAALAVGTAMGLSSAVILYIGSYLLSDRSKVEDSALVGAEALPESIKRRYRIDKSAAKKWARSDSNFVERAMLDSLARTQKKPAVLQEVDESEEDDDYFGPNDSTATLKGKGRSTGDLSPLVTTASRRTPTHFGPPLPVGATGWNHSRSDSSNSSPAVSPAAHRSFTPNGASNVYASALNKLGASPLNSPDVFRSTSSRQRRGVSASL